MKQAHTVWSILQGLRAGIRQLYCAIKSIIANYRQQPAPLVAVASIKKQFLFCSFLSEN